MRSAATATVSSSVFITGIGLATPLGPSAVTTWAALCEGRAVKRPARVPLEEGETPHSPRVNRIAHRVAVEAIENAQWTPEQTRQAALIVGTSKGPVDEWLAAATHHPPARASVLLGLADTAFHLARQLQVTGPRLTLCAACASGLAALSRAALMIRTGQVERALVVACESSLHPLFLASFDRLGVLAPGDYGCRPFDISRRGFVISEAAAAICLEAASSANRPGANDGGRLWAIVERDMLAADATHLTSTDADGVVLRRALARLTDDFHPDLIHAHGTGTISNDPIELAAIEQAMTSGLPPHLYSHKGALGHSLGAAGLVAVAINCLSHRHGVIPPNVGTRTPIALNKVALETGLVRRPIDRSLAIAAGFGGAIAAVALRNAASGRR